MSGVPKGAAVGVRRRQGCDLQLGLIAATGIAIRIVVDRVRDRIGEGARPGRVLIVLMTSALVVAIWGVARGRLVSIVETALNTVCGPIGC